MAATRAHVEAMAASAEPAYGISTGFGGLATRADPAGAAGPAPALAHRLARRRHGRPGRARGRAGDGAPPGPHAGHRASPAPGPSWRPRCCDLLDDGRLPEVPEFGSLGCSGDLAPLAHVATALDLTLEAKEGLALINGTDGMLGMLVLACADLAGLLRAADVAAAMSVEGLLGTDRAFAADLVALRPHPGQQASAANIAALLAGSAIVASHRTDDPRVQDAYSLRCAPQVHGAARDALAFAETCADRELAVRHRQPGGAGRRPGRVGGQLPRGAAGPRLRPAGHRRRRRRRHERAPHRPLPRRRPQPRPAAVPGRTSPASTAA